MPDDAAWIAATRASHDRLTGLLVALGPEQVTGPSYASEWSIADAASHLGSQAEIFNLFLDAAFAGAPTPGTETFGPIWDRWNARAPMHQVSDSIASNEVFVRRLEQLTEAERGAFPVPMFGRQLELSGLLAMRLGEHAMHTWDIEVALDPNAGVAPSAVELLIDTVEGTAARVSVSIDGLDPVSISTTDPQRLLRLVISPAVSLSAAEMAEHDAVQLPAEALLRLVYGRLDPDHTPEGVVDDHTRLSGLRTVFPGF